MHSSVALQKLYRLLDLECMDLLKGANRMHIQMTRGVVDATPQGMGHYICKVYK